MAFWLAVLGIILALIGSFVALVAWMSKSIATGAEHNINTCPCVDCQRRRDTRYLRQKSRDEPGDADLYATYELRRHWVVEVKGVKYRVKQSVLTVAGYQLNMVDLRTRRDTVLMVKLINASNKMWRRV